MKIDSGLNGHYYPHRTVEMDRKTEEAPQRETTSVQRSPNAITGSSTLLSSSLANALWVMETEETGAGQPEMQMPVVKSDWVAGVYQEFA